MSSTRGVRQGGRRDRQEPLTARWGRPSAAVAVAAARAVDR